MPKVRTAEVVRDLMLTYRSLSLEDAQRIASAEGYPNFESELREDDTDKDIIRSLRASLMFLQSVVRILEKRDEENHLRMRLAFQTLNSTYGKFPQTPPTGTESDRKAF